MWAYLAASASTAADAAVNPAEILQIIVSVANLGVLGVVFWLFVNGKLHSSGEMDREVETRKKAEDQRDEALGFLRDHLAPLVADFTRSTSSLLPILQALVTRLELTSREDPRDRERP